MVFLGVKKERVMERQPLRGILQLQIVELKAVTPQTLLSELFELPVVDFNDILRSTKYLS